MCHSPRNYRRLLCNVQGLACSLGRVWTEDRPRDLRPGLVSEAAILHGQGRTKIDGGDVHGADAMSASLYVLPAALRLGRQ